MIYTQFRWLLNFFKPSSHCPNLRLFYNTLMSSFPLSFSMNLSPLELTQHIQNVLDTLVRFKARTIHFHSMKEEGWYWASVHVALAKHLELSYSIEPTPDNFTVHLHGRVQGSLIFDSFKPNATKPSIQDTTLLEERLREHCAEKGYESLSALIDSSEELLKGLLPALPKQELGDTQCMTYSLRYQLSDNSQCNPLDLEVYKESAGAYLLPVDVVQSCPQINERMIPIGSISGHLSLVSAGQNLTVLDFLRRDADALQQYPDILAYLEKSGIHIFEIAEKLEALMAPASDKTQRFYFASYCWENCIPQDTLSVHAHNLVDLDLSTPEKQEQFQEWRRDLAQYKQSMRSHYQPPYYQNNEGSEYASRLAILPTDFVLSNPLVFDQRLNMERKHSFSCRNDFTILDSAEKEMKLKKDLIPAQPNKTMPSVPRF